MDVDEVIKGLEALRDICNARSNIFVGDARIVWAGYGKTASDAIALLKEQDAEISNISNAYLDLVGKASKKPEIVRCKDCKDACIYSDDWVICTHIDSNGNDKHPADWFCADGERKKGR